MLISGQEYLIALPKLSTILSETTMPKGISRTIYPSLGPDLVGKVSRPNRISTRTAPGHKKQKTIQRIDPPVTGKRSSMHDILKAAEKVEQTESKQLHPMGAVQTSDMRYRYADHVTVYYPQGSLYKLLHNPAFIALLIALLFGLLVGLGLTSLATP